LHITIMGLARSRCPKTCPRLPSSGQAIHPYTSEPASGRRFKTRGVQILHFDEEGRIVTHDNFFNRLSTMVQLGFAQPPPQQ